MRIKGEMDVEVIQDTTLADATRKARRREKLCVMDADQQERFAYDPNSSKLDDNPGFPADDYGGMDKD